MKQTGKRFVSLALAVMMLVVTAGCSSGGTQDKGKEGAGGAEQESTKGRYVERILETPKDFKGKGSMGVLEDGSLIIVDSENGIVSKSKDEGQSWTADENMGKKLKEVVNRDQVELTSVAVAPDGGLFFSYILWEESNGQKKTYPEQYVYIDNKGKENEFELGLEKYKCSLRKAVFTKEKKLYVLTNSEHIYEIDCKKKTAKKVEEADRDLYGIFPYGNTFAVTGKDKVFIYDAKQGKMDSSDEALNQFIQGEKSEQVVLGGSQDDKILAAHSGGIYSHVKAGTVMEQLADGSMTSLSNPSHNPVALFELGNGVLLLLYDSGELDSYTYDPEAKTVPDKQLSVYSLYENTTVRQSIHAFRKKHPDVYVKVINGLSGDDGVTESDAVKNLNTQLLAGEGPDVIMMDGMPLDSYVEKGMLLELNDIVAQLESESGYYKNILEAYQSDGKLFTVPIRFALPVIAGESDRISGIKDLGTLADAVEAAASSSGVKETVFGTYDETELLQRLWVVCAGAWVKDGKTVDKQAVTEFLTQAKKIYKGEQKNLSSSAKQKHQEMVSMYKKNNMEFDPQNGDRQLSYMLMGSSKIVAGLFRSMSELRNLFSVVNKDQKVSWQHWQGQQSNTFVPTGLTSISSNAADKELAAEFVKTLLGTEVQKNDLGDGFPVNKEAFATYSEDPDKGKHDSRISVSGGEGSGSYDLNLVWPTKEQLGQVEKVFENCQMPANTMRRIQEEVYRIAAGALSGEKEIEACAEEIYQKIQLLYEE